MSFVEPDFEEEPHGPTQAAVREVLKARRSARASAIVALYVAVLLAVVGLGAAVGVGVVAFRFVVAHL